MPLYPYIAEVKVDLGTRTEQRIQYYFSNKDPKEVCKECREAKKLNPKYVVNYKAQGSSRCQKHIDRYRKNMKKLEIVEEIVKEYLGERFLEAFPPMTIKHG